MLVICHQNKVKDCFQQESAYKSKNSPYGCVEKNTYPSTCHQQPVQYLSGYCLRFAANELIALIFFLNLIDFHQIGIFCAPQSDAPFRNPIAEQSGTYTDHCAALRIAQTVLQKKPCAQSQSNADYADYKIYSGFLLHCFPSIDESVRTFRTLIYRNQSLD